MMFIIFIIITYTRDKNCQLTSRRWKVLLNNLAFLWWGGGGRGVFPPENLSLFQAEIREFSYPISQFSVWNAVIKSRQEPIPTFSFKPCLKRVRNLTLFQAQTVAVYTHFHTKTFSFKKKTTKMKKNSLAPQKRITPPPPSGPPKLLKYSKLNRRTRCHSRQFLW